MGKNPQNTKQITGHIIKNIFQNTEYQMPRNTLQTS